MWTFSLLMNSNNESSRMTGSISRPRAFYFDNFLLAIVFETVAGEVIPNFICRVQEIFA